MINVYEINEEYFKKINKENAYIIGFIFADGHLYKNENRISIGQKEKEILKQIKKKLSSDHPITKQKNCYIFRFGNKKIYNDLKRFVPVGKKSHIIKFPDFKDDEITFHFIRGYFDGDGCVHKLKNRNDIRVTISSSSREFLNGMASFLEKKDIRCSVKKDKIYNSLGIYAKKQVTAFFNNIYDDADIYLERKKNIFTGHYAKIFKEQFI